MTGAAGHALLFFLLFFQLWVAPGCRAKRFQTHGQDLDTNSYVTPPQSSNIDC